MIRQFLVESLVLSSAGCLVGVLAGRVAMSFLALAAPRDIPRVDAVVMDWRVLAVSAAIAIVSGAVFGVLPAWQASRTRPAESLAGSGRVTGERLHGRWRAALTVAELSISLVLLVAAGLDLRSFVTVLGVDLGFHTRNVLTANVNLPEPRYKTPLQRLQFFEELERRLSGLAGVESVAYGLFEVRPHDVLTYAATTVLLLVAAVLASAIPARRAAHVDPLVALRRE